MLPSSFKSLIKRPSKQHRGFSKSANKIIGTSLSNYNFIKHIESIDNYSTSITWRKNNLYVKIMASTYPQDYPYTFDILLGEGNSEDFFEYDWKSTSISKFKPITGNKIITYDFISFDKIKQNVVLANDDLIEYGVTFLKGDLSEYHNALKIKNKNRGSYKTHKAREEYLKSNNIFSKDF